MTVKRGRERDADGRLPGAAGWRGDLTTASPKALDTHDGGLMSMISNLTVKWDGSAVPPTWRPSTAQEREVAQLDRWVNRLVEVRIERNRREGVIGGPGPYIELLVSPDGEKPWSDAAAPKRTEEQ